MSSPACLFQFFPRFQDFNESHFGVVHCTSCHPIAINCMHSIIKFYFVCFNCILFQPMSGPVCSFNFIPWFWDFVSWFLYGKWNLVVSISSITTLSSAFFTQRDHKNQFPSFCQLHVENSCSVIFHSLGLKEFISAWWLSPYCLKNLVYIFLVWHLGQSFYNIFFCVLSPFSNVRTIMGFALFWYFSFSAWILKGVKISSLRSLSSLEMVEVGLSVCVS